MTVGHRSVTVSGTIACLQTILLKDSADQINEVTVYSGFTALPSDYVFFFFLPYCETSCHCGSTE